ncbi:MAG: MMPL family transporter [Proteobacteria bacterium]|nr:MMPL family transporter [Pseudomonadota bacterium]MBU1713995.1 MMPL family transporter [Pseudomonadota bacterium]
MKGSALTQLSIKNPKLVTTILVLLTLALAALIIMVKVDTDPENMLSATEPVRLFHHQVKKEFTLHDMVVLGVVNEKHPNGVFNPATLNHVHELTEFVKTLHDPNHPEMRVVTENLISPGTVDTIEQAGLGQVSFDWLMKTPPTTEQEALKIRDNAMGNPLLKGTLISEDEKAIGIYIPISSKDFAAQVRKRLLKKIESFSDQNGDQFYITGLPVAEDTFGQEMFIQMAISAPLAMLAIFLLMLLFFKQLKLIIAPMIIAMMSVFCTMGLLIGTGNTLHIMSSMIPIFLMPIAVVDSIHILSEFFDSYPAIKDRRKTIEHVMGQLFTPMLYTSLTSAAGFASLALTPIPPVQAFGIFVAIGIMLAWLFTILFVPAYVMLMSEKSLEGFGVSAVNKDNQPSSALSRFLKWMGGFTYKRSKLIMVFTLLTLLVAGYGINKIVINDNPIKWFTPSHPIRVADRVLNHHFAGTYEAYLVLTGAEPDLDQDGVAALLNKEITGPEITPTIAQEAMTLLSAAKAESKSADELLTKVAIKWEEQMDAAPDETYNSWVNIVDLVDKIRNRDQIFKQPIVLNYLASLQKYLLDGGIVGKSNSVTDVVKKVHQELFAGESEYYRVPDSIGAVSECLISFQNSHKPDDLFHFVTPDYTKANIWLQLRNGDNQGMEAVVKSVEKFMADNPPPVALNHQWAGLTYLNIVWQDKMVSGMREAFLGSFVIVFVMMVILFRSVLWGMLAMVPLSVTIAIIYGIIGLIGKEYDMPVAVLSSLTLGLAVDFAIHFLERSRMTFKKTGSWKAASKEMFEEPARAITKNVIVIAVGFTPLLAAPLVPYKTVGVFLASIMAISGIGTMIILPAMITIMQKWLFKKNRLNIGKE